MRIDQHVVRREHGWAVVGEGNSRDTSVHPTQKEAVERARQIAANYRGEVVIHDQDGEADQKSGTFN